MNKKIEKLKVTIDYMYKLQLYMKTFVLTYFSGTVHVVYVEHAS